MFSRTNVATVARLASRAVEGEGAGHTVYAEGTAPRRYVVGGYTPTLLFPVSAPSGHMRVRVWDWAQADAARFAEALGYWEHEGTIYVDFGTTHASIDDALRVAASRGELAIYDRETGQCITVEGNRDTPGIQAALHCSA